MTTAKFHNLTHDAHYDIIDSETGTWLTRGIQGATAIATAWRDDAEAWPAGTTDFDASSPVEIARPEASDWWPQSAPSVQNAFGQLIRERTIGN
jgi:hypothetical protein